MNKTIMKKKYEQIIKKTNSLNELNDIKNDFLAECKKQENKINVSNILYQIDNFCGAKTLFESLAPSLMRKKGGKNIINKYVNVIKENKSLKTIYAYYEGLKNSKKPENKKAYITEALSITNPIQYNEYVKGIGDIINVISESFKLLGDEYVLNNVSYDKNSSIIGESLVYLSTTKKNIKNLNEYMSHIDRVSNNLVENNEKNINTDLTLEEIVSDMKQQISESNVDDIFNTDNKENTFQKSKNICMEMISKQKKSTNDNEIISKLNEMEEKLSKKQYTYETYTKDMLYMTELQEVLS